MTLLVILSIIYFYQNLIHVSILLWWRFTYWDEHSSPIYYYSNMTIFTWLYSFHFRRHIGKWITKIQVISLRFYILGIGTSKEVWEQIRTLSSWVVLGNIPELFKCYFISEMNMIVSSSIYKGRIKGDHVCNAARILPSHWKHSMFSSVQSFSHVPLFVTPWTTACQASLSITNSQSSPKPMSIESVMPFNHLILFHPLLLLPSIFPSFKVFSNESALCIRWPKYWSFSFNISPSNKHPGLISFRMDWLDLLAVQGTLKSLFQHHSSKASILQCSAFFIVQLLHPYMTTGKTIALTRWTFVGKIMSAF